MKTWIIDLVLKYSGASALWSLMDGYKLYGTGALAILGAIVGLGSELAPVLAAHNTAALFALITHVNSDPAYLALLAGFATIAAAHRADKSAAQTPVAPLPSQP